MHYLDVQCTSESVRAQYLNKRVLYALIKRKLLPPEYYSYHMMLLLSVFQIFTGPYQWAYNHGYGDVVTGLGCRYDPQTYRSKDV